MEDAINRFQSQKKDIGNGDDRFPMLAHLLSYKNWTYDEFLMTILTVVGDSLNTVSITLICI